MTGLTQRDTDAGNGAQQSFGGDHPSGAVDLLDVGAGTKRFFTGAGEDGDTDIKEINRTGRMVTTETLLHAIPRRGVPLVGHCIGMGMTLALHYDLRLAKGAVLGYPEVRHGMISAVSALHLPQVIPSAQALEMLLAGRDVSATWAKIWGSSWPRPIGGRHDSRGNTSRRCRPPRTPRNVLRRTSDAERAEIEARCKRWLRRTTILQGRRTFPAADDDGYDAGGNVPRLRRSGGARTGPGRSS